MNTQQTLFVTLVGLLLLTLIFELVRRQYLQEKYSLLWIFIGLALFSVPWFYPLYVRLGRWVGVYEASSFFFFLSILGLLAFCLQFTMILSKARKQRKTLTQQIALLEERIQRLEEKKEP